VADAARRRTHAQITTAVIPGGGVPLSTVVLPPVPLPSVPFLDEVAQPATFRKVTILVAGQTGGLTAPANWTLVVTVRFQPLKGGPAASFTLPAASITNLAVSHDWLAAPGATLNITCTNNGPAGDTLTLSYGGMVAPNWIDIDGKQ
jgi:hypothetical protein